VGGNLHKKLPLMMNREEKVSLSIGMFR